MSEWLESFRTTKTMWLPPVASSRTRWAMYTPETAVVGTVHDADTAQFPQSISPVGCVSVRQAGWVCGSVADGLQPRGHLPGAVALVVAQPKDVDVVRSSHGVLILNRTVSPGLTLIDGGEALDRRSTRLR